MNIKTGIFSIIIIAIMSFHPKDEPIFILPVGDSITQGGKRDKQEYTYRLPLQMMLHKNGIAYDFIGSQSKGLHEDATWPEVAKNVPFDPDHEGYYGNKTRKVVDKVMAAWPSYEKVPDMVLIHLGTNDQKAGDYKNTVGQPLREFIEFLQEKNPEVIVFLGHLNFEDGEAAKEIRKVVAKVAIDYHTEKSPVVTVNHYENFIEQPDKVYTDTFDWAHPNLKGQEKMARKWFEAMKGWL